MDYHRYLELQHAGVLGMKWGRRKAKPPGVGRKIGQAKPSAKVSGLTPKAGRKRLTAGQKWVRRTLIELGVMGLSTAGASILIGQGKETAANIVFNVGVSAALIDSAVAGVRYRQDRFNELFYE